MAELDTQEPISNISDSSFVILGQGSLPSQLNEDQSIKENPKPDSLINSKSTFSLFESTNSSVNDKFQSKLFMDGSYVCQEDFQKKLDDIVKENQQLKETLIQNNVAIKTQLDTFFMWQQEVLKTHETHKQKFLETKDMILKLRAENINLKKQLEDSLQELSRVASVNGEDNSLQTNKDLEQLKEKTKELEETCNNLNKKNENLILENVNLQEKLKFGKNEILKLHRELMDSERENELLKQRSDDTKKNSLESMSHRSLPNAEARTQISNLLKQLEEEKEKVAKLQEELKRLKPSNADVIKTPTEELNGCISKIDVMKASLEKENERFCSLQSWVTLAEENLKENKMNVGIDDKLVSELNEMKSQLNGKGDTFKEKQECLDELKVQYNRLLCDYKDLQMQLNGIKNDEPNTEKYREAVMNLKSELEAKNKQILLKDEECEKLKEAVGKLQVQSEEAATLKFQAHLYKIDFKEEQEARRKIEEEKEELAEKIAVLESRLVELEGEPSPLESPGKKKTYKCPKCMFSFHNLKMCEEHVNECIDIHFYP